MTTEKERIAAAIAWLESRPEIPADLEIAGAWIKTEAYLRHHISEIVRTVNSDLAACHMHLNAVAAVAGAIQSKSE
jgi:hypothetical protein